MFASLSKAFFHGLSRSSILKKLASRYGMRRPSSFARRFIAGETVAEAIEAARALEDLSQVVDRARLVDVEPELSQFQRDVAPYARRDHRLDDIDVVACRRVRRGEARDALAEQVHRDGQPAAFDGSRGLDRFRDGFAGDEAAREARRLAHPVA